MGKHEVDGDDFSLDQVFVEADLLAFVREHINIREIAPVRLLVPGWSGNWSVKWLTRLELTEGYVKKVEDIGRKLMLRIQRGFNRAS
jgi:DMSO/TMAO reductase YedYZ molybdopterin-dependent catalytic subunit